MSGWVIDTGTIALAAGCALLFGIGALAASRRRT